jgi:HD-GYP domain-containing protein (c-di-GMP phosphodiesterase class II)
MSHEEALEELKKYAGSQFDPQLVEIFMRLLAGERESCTEKNV